VLGPGTLSKRLIVFAFLLRAGARGFGILEARTQRARLKSRLFVREERYANSGIDVLGISGLIGCNLNYRTNNLLSQLFREYWPLKSSGADPSRIEVLPRSRDYANFDFRDWNIHLDRKYYFAG